MDPYGHLYTEGLIGKHGKEYKQGRKYQRSLPLDSIKLSMSLESKPTRFVRADVKAGYFKFDLHRENGVITAYPIKGASFELYGLAPVNNEENGDDKVQVGVDFYPALYRILRNKKEWDNDFTFVGQAAFEASVLERTRDISESFADILHQSGIYGGVIVSRHPYECNKQVWRAFCELWGPLSNTLHCADGEMSISLYDLNVICGLPISGVPYKEFVPSNKDLSRPDLYPATVLELLRIHSALCVGSENDVVFWDQWVHHFFHGKLKYAGFGNGPNKLPPERPRKYELNISEEGRLAAFLAYWLSRFVLPTRRKKVRPETFHMACLMAQGWVSLAPTVLGYIYHGLGEIATHPSGPHSSNLCFPIHYVVGWLGEYFPYLYKRNADSTFPKD